MRIVQRSAGAFLKGGGPSSLLLIAAGAACASDPDTSEVARAVAPAGSDAEVVGHTIPSVMVVGQTVNGVTVTMRNTGAASPSNDWNANYELRRTSADWFDFDGVDVTGTVVVGDEVTFTFSLTAPTNPTARNLRVRMRSNIPGAQGAFGDSLTVRIQVVRNALDAQLVSQTIPSPIPVGSSATFSITMRNSGASPWTGENFRLVSVNTPAGLWGVLEGGALNPGETVAYNQTRTFVFTVTAPAAAETYVSRWQMSQVGGAGNFGTIAERTGIIVNMPAQFDAEVVEQIIPLHLFRNTSARFTITMRNTGTATWTSAYNLRSRNNPVNVWSVQSVAIPAGTTVAPGQTITFSFLVTAPNTLGIYESRWQMRRNNNNNNTLFGDEAATTGILVDDVSTNDAVVDAQAIPSLVDPGATASFAITMRNWGSTAWTAGSAFRLGSVNTPVAVWGVTSGGNVTTTVVPGDLVTFSFDVTGPLVPGSYDSAWRMEQVGAGGAGPGFFGATALTSAILVPLNVDAEVVSQNIPAVIEPGAAAVFEVTMRNSGVVAWMGSTFQLASANTPSDGWSTLATPLGATESVAVGETKTFSFAVTAPSTPGTYDSEWIMEQLGGAGPFGDAALTTGILVTFCGNGTVDASEQCDDGARVDGDGCSATCQIESIEVDLLSGSDRTFIGSTTSGQASLLAIGDANDDGIEDLLIGEAGTVLARRRAGRVVGFSGAGLLDGSSSVLPAGASFEILGAQADDILGAGGSSGLIVADVTGDGVPEVIVSAPRADGVGNAKDSAGETYVIQGGPGLTGTVDLGAATPDPRLLATIIGRDPLDLSRVIAVGDLDGDAIADLVIGAPDSNLGGALSGAVFIVRGGPSLSGTIDLASPATSLIATITGAQGGDHLGFTAAVGEVGGSIDDDLLLGAQVHAEGGRTNTGGAWLLFGPLSGTVSLATNFDARWFGATSSDRWGASVAIGNVLGTASADVVLGGMQHRNAALQQVGAVDVWAGPIVAGSTFDLSAGATPNARIQGAAQYDDAGTSLVLADYDGDGFLDIPVVSSQADGPGDLRDRAGEVSLVLGGTSLPTFFDLAITTPTLRLYGADALGRLGRHASNVAFGTLGGSLVLCAGAYIGGGTGAPGRVDCVRAP